MKTIEIEIKGDSYSEVNDIAGQIAKLFKGRTDGDILLGVSRESATAKITLKSQVQ